MVSGSLTMICMSGLAEAIILFNLVSSYCFVTTYGLFTEGCTIFINGNILFIFATDTKLFTGLSCSPDMSKSIYGQLGSGT